MNEPPSWARLAAERLDLQQAGCQLQSRVDSILRITRQRDAYLRQAQRLFRASQLRWLEPAERLCLDRILDQLEQMYSRKRLRPVE